MKNPNSILFQGKNYGLLFLILCIHLMNTACSKSSLQKLFADTAKIDYEKPEDYRQFNKYEKDALHLVALIQQSYPRLSSKIADYKEASENYLQQVALAKDEYAFDIATRKFMALLKDGHSKSGVLINDKERFNLRLFREQDAWLISRIDQSLDSMLIGAKVLSINGQSMQRVHQLVSTIECGENEFYRLMNFGFFISIPKYLEAVEIIEPGADLELVMVKEGIEKSITLKRALAVDLHKADREAIVYPFTQKQNDGFYTKIDTVKDYAYLQMNTSLDFVSVKAEASNYLNPLVKPVALLLMKKELKDAPNFGWVLQDLFQQIEKEAIGNLIIDLRYNKGGDERLGKQLLWYLNREQEIKGFTSYSHNSDFYRQSMKKDYRLQNKIYKKKYGKDLPDGEINDSEEFYNKPYFYEIEKPDAPYLLDSSIAKFKGKIYVLIGVHTFSAGQVLATTLFDNGIGTFVGTPTGNRPTCQTGVSIAKLPKTNKIIGLSNSYMERPDHTRHKEDALHPHVAIYPSFEKSYLQNQDEAFDFILQEITNTTTLANRKTSSN